MSTPPADLLLVNGTIDTLTIEQPRTSSLAVIDGRVAALGDSALLLRGDSTVVIDLEGSYVMPGLLDVHNHHLLAGQMDLFELNTSPTLGLTSSSKRAVRAGC